MTQWQESDLQKRREIAEQQLREWEHIAGKWPGYLDRDSDSQSVTQWPYRCSMCHQTIYFTRDSNGIHFNYTGAEELALTVAHIRQNHDRG